MDPVEKVALVAARLPARPFLMRRRNGEGFRHYYLRFAHRRGRQDRNAKKDIYLGRLTPMQMAAIRQAISDAWPVSQRCDPHRRRHMERVRSFRRDYREARKLLAVLAERAGYRLHGNKVRKARVMKPSLDRLEDMVKRPELVGLPADEWVKRVVGDPEQGFLEAMELLYHLNRAFIHQCVEYQKATRGATVPRTVEECRAMITFQRAWLSFVTLGEAILRLKNRRQEKGVGDEG